MSDFTPLNPDGTPMTPEQIAAAKAESEARALAGQYTTGADGHITGTAVDAVNGPGSAAANAAAANAGQPIFDEGRGNAATGPSSGSSGVLHYTEPRDPTYFDTFRPANVQDTTTAGWQQTLGAQLSGVQNRAPMTMDGATIATGPQDQFRAQQMNLAQLLGAGARGEGPSAAQSQLKLATDRNMSQALSLALAARGGNQAAALKQAQMQRALIGQEAGAQSAAIAAQEQQAAQQALGQVLATGRGADIGLATQQAGFDQQTGATNLDAQIRQQQANDQLVQKYLAMGMTLDEAQRQAQVQQNQFAASLLAQQEAAQQGVGIQAAAQGIQLLGAGASGLGSLLTGAMTASDERVKHDVKSGERPLAELLGAVGAHDYEYDEPDEELRGHGRFVSPMAQEIEETQIGKSMVREVDGTKVVDYGKGLGAMLSGLGWLHKRMTALEMAGAH